MLTLTSSHRTWAHRLPAGPKLALLALWAVLVLRLPLAGAALAALGLAGLILSLGRGFAGEWLRMLRPLWPLAAVLALWQLWLGTPAEALALVLRLGATLGLANAVTMTTELSAVIAVLAQAARPLARLGLSPRVLALSVALMIRFVPVMLIRHDQIHAAWRARSPRRAGWRILMPVLLAALDDAERVAEALRARGGAG